VFVYISGVVEGLQSQWHGGKVVRSWEGETRLQEARGWLVQEEGGWLFLEVYIMVYMR
jgi:hypothetical protein